MAQTKHITQWTALYRKILSLFSAVQILRGHVQDSFATIRRLCYTEPT